ncbi:hypothetical protein Hanom_Chr07g00639251 [Helianthus anomalus]
MHHVVALIAERQGGACTNRRLSQLLSGVSFEATSLFLRGRGKAVYISPSSDPTLALLLVGYTEYDDDDDDDDDDDFYKQVIQI